MRKLVFVIAAAAFGALSVSAEAMPAIGSSSVAQPTTVNPAIQKTEVVIVKKRPVVRKRVVVVKKRPVVVVRKRPVIVVH